MPVQFVERRGVYYGWIVVAVMFVTLFFVLGFRYAFGVFYVAILDDTGWMRAQTAGIFSVAMVVYALFSIISGALFDAIGPRRQFPIGAALLAVGLVLCATIVEPWQVYVYYGVLVGISYALLGFIPHMAFVPRWFIRRRGLASGLVAGGIGMGSLVLSVVSEDLVAWLGWRYTFGLYGLLALLLIPLTALLHRDSPQSVGLLPDGDKRATSTHTHASGLAGPTLRRTLTDPGFWLLLAAVTMVGMATMTMVVHQTSLLVDMGYSLSLSAALFGLTGLLRSLGGLVWGPLSDRIGRRWCAVYAAAAGVVGLALLFAARTNPNLFLLTAFILLFGVGFSGISPVYAATVADLFPGRNLGKTMGLLDQGFGLGAAGGPYVAGLLYDRMGNYQGTLIMLMVGMVAFGAALFAAASRKRPHTG